MPRHKEAHLIDRIGWLRASVLGANDGIVSTASLIVGVAAAQASPATILLTGIAGLVAGAMSMAAGEYVSVSSQADTEAADRNREKLELETVPEKEREELVGIYEARGLDRMLAEQVADKCQAQRQQAPVMNPDADGGDIQSCELWTAQAVVDRQQCQGQQRQLQRQARVSPAHEKTQSGEGQQIQGRACGPRGCHGSTTKAVSLWSDSPCSVAETLSTQSPAIFRFSPLRRYRPCPRGMTRARTVPMPA